MNRRRNIYSQLSPDCLSPCHATVGMTFVMRLFVSCSTQGLWSTTRPQNHIPQFQGRFRWCSISFHAIYLVCSPTAGWGGWWRNQSKLDKILQFLLDFREILWQRPMRCDGDDDDEDARCSALHWLVVVTLTTLGRSWGWWWWWLVIIRETKTMWKCQEKIVFDNLMKINGV